MINSIKEFENWCDKTTRILDNQNIRMLLLLKDTKIDYEHQFEGDCVLYNDDCQAAYEFTNIPAKEIFEIEFSEEVHGWKILCADHYEWWIKENLSKGEAIDYTEFKDSLKR